MRHAAIYSWSSLSNYRLHPCNDLQVHSIHWSCPFNVKKNKLASHWTFLNLPTLYQSSVTNIHKPSHRLDLSKNRLGVQVRNLQLDLDFVLLSSLLVILRSGAHLSGRRGRRGPDRDQVASLVARSHVVGMCHTGVPPSSTDIWKICEPRSRPIKILRLTSMAQVHLGNPWILGISEI